MDNQLKFIGDCKHHEVPESDLGYLISWYFETLKEEQSEEKFFKCVEEGIKSKSFYRNIRIADMLTRK